MNAPIITPPNCAPVLMKLFAFAPNFANNERNARSRAVSESRHDWQVSGANPR